MLLSLRHLARRLGRQPLVTGSVMLGVALAIALGVAAALATNALATLGLRATLEALPHASQQIQMTRTGTPFEASFRQRVRAQLGDLVTRDYEARYLSRGVGRRETPLIENPVRPRAQEQILEHVRLVGRAPGPQAPSRLRRAEPGCEVFPVLEAMTSEQQLAESGLRLGDRLCVDGIVPVEIVGAYMPLDREDMYWHSDLRPIEGERLDSGEEAGALVVVLIFSAEDLAGITPFFEGSTHILRLQTDMAVVSLDTLSAVDARLRSFRSFVNTAQPRPALLTGIDRAIGTFNERFRLLQSALATLLLGVVALALIYLILLGTLATEQQSAEIAILRSRGASTRQVIGFQIGQALGMAVPGALAGAGLGAVAALLLARTSMFQRLRGGGTLPWRFTADDWLLVGGIFVLGLLGLILAARPALATSSVTLRQERARPPRRSGPRRAQLDALLVLFAVIGWWQLRRYGGGTFLDGAARFNLLVLGAPILIMVGGALLFLRLFPFLARVLGQVLARRRGIVPALGAWQLARNPLPYGRLVLLLTLTVGLGVYADVVSNALQREQLRQALGEVGADARVALEPDDNVDALLAAYPNATATLLTRANAEIVRRAGNVVERVEGTSLLVGVDGPAASAVLAQSGVDDESLLAALRVVGAGSSPPLGLPLPARSERVDVMLKATGSGFEVVAKFAGLNGVREARLGTPGDQWQVFSAMVPTDLEEPIMLQSLIARPMAFSRSTGAQSVYVDRLEASVGDATVLLHDFDRVEEWQAVGVGQRDALASAAPGVDQESSSVRLSFSHLGPGRWAALRFRIDASLPVYTAREVRGPRLDPGQALTLRVGEQIIDATVQSRVGRLPGLDDISQNVLLADRARLAALLTYGLPTSIRPSELRLALPAGVEPGALPRAETKAAALTRLASDPLGNGVQVILLLGFMCAIVLSIVGFVTYAALSVRARRIEIAVLSALGLSSREMLLLIGMEQGLVLGSGVLAGTLVGLLLAMSTRPFLQIVTRASGTSPVLVDWASLALLIGALVVALATALALLLGTLHARALKRTLKLGEAQ